MLVAIVNGIRRTAHSLPKGTVGTDPQTGRPVVLRKGYYRSYFVYSDGFPPEIHGEPETEWHIAWKTGINAANCEVIFGNGEHRADIYNGTEVIEVQNSAISFGDASERTLYYYRHLSARTIWVVNAYRAWSDRRIIIGEYVANMTNVFRVKWKHAKSWAVDICSMLESDMYIDFNPRSNKLIKIWSYRNELYGSWYSRECFYNRYLSDIADKQTFLSAFKDLDISRYR